jgi:hypothetical protein
VTDDYYDPKHCTPDRKLKPRRPTPHMRASELFGDGRLTRTRDGRWIFKVARCGGGGGDLFFLRRRSVSGYGLEVGRTHDHHREE